jgi:hypothetical protein
LPHVFSTSFGIETYLQIRCTLVIFGAEIVSIATRYGLDGPGIESWLGRDFPHPSRLDLGPTQTPIQWVPGSFQGVKRPGHGVNHRRPSSAEVKERVELYL